LFVLATKVILALRELKVQLVHRVPLALKEQLELKEPLAHRELLAPPETLDRKVQRALRVQ
jgi:hypothetical protein